MLALDPCRLVCRADVWRFSASSLSWVSRTTEPLRTRKAEEGKRLLRRQFLSALPNKAGLVLGVPSTHPGGLKPLTAAKPNRSWGGKAGGGGADTSTARRHPPSYVCTTKTLRVERLLLTAHRKPERFLIFYFLRIVSRWLTLPNEQQRLVPFWQEETLSRTSLLSRDVVRRW